MNIRAELNWEMIDPVAKYFGASVERPAYVQYQQKNHTRSRDENSNIVPAIFLEAR
jgi:hypothetical protein